MHLRHSWVIALVLVAVGNFGCRLSETAPDAGQIAAGDGGTDASVIVPPGDAGSIADYQLCPADAGPPPPERGGLVWHSELLPTATPPQDAGWVAVSTDPECAALSPASVPPALSWNVTDGGAACDPARVDGQGDLGVDWLNATGITTSFFNAKGTTAGAVHDGNLRASTPEAVRSFSIRASGFVLVSKVFSPWCYFIRSVDEEGNPAGLPIQSGTRFDEDLEMLFPNPMGGAVEARETTDGQLGPKVTATLDVRFVDDSFQPVGDWHTVITHHQENLSWALGVDQQGRALILGFMYPPSLGPPPPPSEWRFTARWMGPTGPLTEEFEPITPTFTPGSSNGSPLFAGWGSFLSLPEGGFAMYQGQANPSYGKISPSGWYTYYPSGQSASEPAPSWLALYNGSLRMLTEGIGYAAMQYNDASSCARTVLLVAQSGRTCFKLDLSDTAGCTGLPDALWPDGTLVLQGDSQSTCKLRWWPGLARPAR